ncbi:transposase [Elysia marginata]|uniref:Transposase n=1 Tax=Elysia marginata TaxID=1093978 RepID=A0AAV4J110_9GAST|nr:transposase [Elysia marginata]
MKYMHYLFNALLILAGWVECVKASSSCDVSQARSDNCTSPGFVYMKVFDKCVGVISEKLNFAFYAQKCNDTGGKLLKIESKQQNEALLNLTTKNRLWIGLRYNYDEKTFYWTSDGSLLPIPNTITKIDTAYLKSSLKMYSYVLWTRKDGSVLWQSYFGSPALNGFCEVDLVSRPRTPTILQPQADSSAEAASNGTVVRLGETFNVTCHAQLGVWGKLGFLLFGENSTRYIDARNSSTLVRYTEEEKLNEDGKCDRFAEATLSLQVIAYLEGKTLACVSHITNYSSIRLCSAYDVYCVNVTTFVLLKDELGDETWFSFFIIPPKRLNRICVDGQGNRPFVLGPGFQSRKRMFTVFLKYSGPLVVDILPQCTTMTATYYAQNVPSQVKSPINEQRPKFSTSRTLLLHDNAGPHKAGATNQSLRDLGVQILPHFAYSADLAPCDFWLFPILKDRLAGRKFDRIQDLTKAENSENGPYRKKTTKACSGSGRSA